MNNTILKIIRLVIFFFKKQKSFYLNPNSLKSFSNVWKSSKIPVKQFELVSKQLTSFKQGEIIPEFQIFLEHLDIIQLRDNSKILEIGCSSGYYSEIIEFHNPSLHYIGIDYSKEFIKLASDQYPKNEFLIADANFLPVKSHVVDCTVLGSVLLHLVRWEDCVEEISHLNSKFLIVHRQPIIIKEPSYYHFKKAYSKKMFEWVLNRDRLIQVFENFDYKLIKESTVNSNESLTYSSILPSTVTFSFKKL